MKLESGNLRSQDCSRCGEFYECWEVVVQLWADNRSRAGDPSALQRLYLCRDCLLCNQWLFGTTITL